MARAPQSRQHPWLSELVAGPPSRHCPQEPVVALPALGAAHQPAVCCARRRASQRRRTPRQRRGRAFASVALLPPAVETASAAAPLASKFDTRSMPSTPSSSERGRWECPNAGSMTYARGRRGCSNNSKTRARDWWHLTATPPFTAHRRRSVSVFRMQTAHAPGQVRCPSPGDGRIHLPTARTLHATRKQTEGKAARATDTTSLR